MLAHRLHMAAAGIGRVKIPAGLIVLLNDSVIPAGWQRFTAADNRLIVGAGGSYAVGATGGSWNGGALTSSSDGGHSGHGLTSVLWSFSGTTPYGLNNAGGAHAHAVTPTYVPTRQLALLIKALQPASKFPAKAAVLSAQALNGLSAVFGNNYYLQSHTAVGVGATSLSGVVGSAGSHNHGSAVDSAWNQQSEDYYSSGAHASHAVSISLVAETIKAVTLRALTSAVEFDLQGGMIGFWEGATAPEGWVVETTMADYFVKLHTAGTGSKGGTNQIQISGSLGSYNAYHVHGSNMAHGIPGGTNRTNYFQALNWAHSHSIGSQLVTYLAPFYALKIIRYVG